MYKESGKARAIAMNRFWNRVHYRYKEAYAKGGERGRSITIIGDSQAWSDIQMRIGVAPLAHADLGH